MICVFKLEFVLAGYIVCLDQISSGEKGTATERRGIEHAELDFKFLRHFRRVFEIPSLANGKLQGPEKRACP